MQTIWTCKGTIIINFLKEVAEIANEVIEM